MELLVYALRCIVTMLVAWLSIRLFGSRSIAQMTSYDFAAIMVISNIAAEPLVYKIESKAWIGTLLVAGASICIGWLSLHKLFYNFDVKPSLLIANGQIDRVELKKNRMNLPFLLSLLRLQGYFNVSEVEFAVLEPNGNLSVLPKSQYRPVQPNDLQLQTAYEGLSLPLILDREIQYNNLKYAHLSVDWLEQELKNAGVPNAQAVFLAELKTTGELFIALYHEQLLQQPELV